MSEVPAVGEEVTSQKTFSFLMLAISSRAALSVVAASSSRVSLASPVLFRSLASRSVVAAAPRLRLAQDRDAPSLFGNRRRTTTAGASSNPDRLRQQPSNTMTASTPTIGTHNGSFHCDEALGVALLRRTAACAGAKVVRSRNPEILDKCDVVIDVGAVYDPARNRFDHHQKEFTDVFGHGMLGDIFFRVSLGGKGGEIARLWPELFSSLRHSFPPCDIRRCRRRPSLSQPLPLHLHRNRLQHPPLLRGPRLQALWPRGRHQAHGQVLRREGREGGRRRCSEQRRRFHRAADAFGRRRRDCVSRCLQELHGGRRRDRQRRGPVRERRGAAVYLADQPVCARGGAQPLCECFWFFFRFRVISGRERRAGGRWREGSFAPFSFPAFPALSLPRFLSSSLALFLSFCFSSLSLFLSFSLSSLSSLSLFLSFPLSLFPLFPLPILKEREKRDKIGGEKRHFGVFPKVTPLTSRKKKLE